MITALEKFKKSMENDADFLTKSATLLYRELNGDTISSRLQTRVKRCTKEIDDLNVSVDSFKKTLEDELEQILKALKNSDD